MYKSLKNIVLFGVLLGLMACGDNSTGPDPSEAPSFPEVQSEQAQPDVSFFENNQPKVFSDMPSTESTDNYYVARNWAISSSYTFAFAGSYAGFLMAGNENDVAYEDGVWVWEYSYQYENESVSLKLTAEDVPGGYKWAMYWSFNDGETSIKDYKVMEGTVSEDGSEGSWTFNTLNTDTNQEQLAYTSEWTVSSNTESTMTVQWYDDSGTTSFTANYDKNEPDHTMTYTNPNDPDITLYWNTDTNEGYYQEGSEKRCWDENFADVTCS